MIFITLTKIYLIFVESKCSLTSLQGFRTCAANLSSYDILY